MKVTELSVCDWINIDGEPIKVEDIYNNGGIYRINYDSVCIDDVEAIPLTEEILKLNGWKRHYDMRLMDEPEYHHDKVCFRLCRSCGILFMYVGDSAFREMSYVHKLQHALRLCGLNELADNFEIQE